MKKDEKSKKEDTIPKTLPLLPLRDTVMFPYMVIPLFVGRKSSIEGIEYALARDRKMILVTQKEPEKESPKPKDLYDVGTVAMVVRMLKLPDERIKILVQGIKKARVAKYVKDNPFYMVDIEPLEAPSEPEITLKLEAMMRNIKDQMDKIISLGRIIPPDVLVMTDTLESPGKLSDLIISNLGLKVEETQAILEVTDPIERLKRLSELLNRELELMAMQQEIQTEAKEKMSKAQRDYFLREQLRAIQKELGEVDEKMVEIDEFKEKIGKSLMPPKVEEEARRQLKRLERMNPDATEASMIRTYLEWLVELPWNKETADNLDIKEAHDVLEEDHYNLEKVKNRILEYLAVRKLKKRMKGPILCFTGPPGVGKTSLGKSIARALGREFVRLSLGGIRDEAEIRGHRRTYVGALPGRIVQGLRQAGSSNPVFMMDEIDKIGADFRGDPAAALLEVLDPEQNNEFSDHYLGVPLDLSNVMFITTANLVDPIPSALKDRMEIIPISGYTDEEKVKIAEKYLIPRQLEENGINGNHLSISNRAVFKIISEYTREAGLRNLEREIAAICRKVARNLAEGDERKFRVGTENLHKYLGASKFPREMEQLKNQVGVATGLAWTQAGGEIITIEATLMKGKGSLTLTGQLGDVMQESAKAALSYTRSRTKELGLGNDIFSKTDIHVHVPAGAIPKDGPSAGITMAAALISALTGVPIKKDVAMTGEITLRGRILPIGGIKEKILAAKRAGIKTVLVPALNKKDLEELPPAVKRGLEFVFTETIDQVLDKFLTKRLKKRTAKR